MDDIKFTQPPHSLNQRKPRNQDNQSRCNQTKKWPKQYQKRNNNYQFNHQRRQYNQPRPQMTFESQNQNTQREDFANAADIFRSPQTAYLPVYIMDRHVLCLVDSGCSFSICPSPCENHTKLHQRPTCSMCEWFRNDCMRSNCVMLRNTWFVISSRVHSDARNRTAYPRVEFSGTRECQVGLQETTNEINGQPLQSTTKTMT